MLRYILPLASLFIALLLSEFILRFFQLAPISWSEPDDLIGFRFTPGAYYYYDKEGFSEGYINSRGLRDYEYGYRKQPGTYRILVLGDSYAEAFQEKRFAVVLLTSQGQVHADQRQELLQRGCDPDKPNRELATFCRRAGIPVLDLVPPLLAYHQQTGRYLHGFGESHGGHWNENGHRVAAEEIFNFLSALLSNRKQEDSAKETAQHTTLLQ